MAIALRTALTLPSPKAQSALRHSSSSGGGMSRAPLAVIFTSPCARLAAASRRMQKWVEGYWPPAAARVPVMRRAAVGTTAARVQAAVEERAAVLLQARRESLQM